MTKTPRHWLIKSEPDAYPFEQLEAERRTEWNGIRNFEARNNLRAMTRGDLCLYYHSGEDKAVVGIARVVSEPKPDSTVPKEDWTAVDVSALARLAQPVPLAAIKASAKLKQIALVRKSRLSVVPLDPKEFAEILRMGKTKLRTK
jgi:predicted RNA-binding protein with PUA-like domain